MLAVIMGGFIVKSNAGSRVMEEGMLPVQRVDFVVNVVAASQ